MGAEGSALKKYAIQVDMSRPQVKGMEAPPSNVVKHSSQKIIPNPVSSSQKGKKKRSKSESYVDDEKIFYEEGKNEVCSRSVPWLLKDIKIHGNFSLEDFELFRVIGKGLVGTVRLAKTKFSKYLAIKIVSKDLIAQYHEEKHIQNEMLILNTLKSEFCVRMISNFQDKYNVYFALEYVPGGELFTHMVERKHFPAEVVRFYITEIFLAIEYIHAMGFVYRDLKLENILLDEDGHVKLVDFGFAKPAKEDTKLYTMCGTPAYLAPEQVDGRKTGYTRAVDWWALGVLLYEMRTGHTPHCSRMEDSHFNVYMSIIKNPIQFPWKFGATGRDLVQQLCCVQFDKRLCHPRGIRIHDYFDAKLWKFFENRSIAPPIVPELAEEGDAHYFPSYEGKPSPAPKYIEQFNDEKDITLRLH